MSQNRHDDDDNDDFSENEQEFVREDPIDDEQHAQKINGKLEAYQSEIENLTRSLKQANSKNKELVDKQARLEQL
jgi:flagellar biosynthesis/type III secretory pathway chaperone